MEAGMIGNRYESFYQRKIMEHLKKRYLDAFFWKAAAGEYSRGGIPDICAIIHGRFYGFEVKRPGGKASRLQEKTLEDIKRAGGYGGVVIYPEDVERIIQAAEETEANGSKRK